MHSQYGGHARDLEQHGHRLVFLCHTQTHARAHAATQGRPHQVDSQREQKKREGDSDIKHCCTPTDSYSHYTQPCIHQCHFQVKNGLFVLFSDSCLWHLEWAERRFAAKKNA